MIKRMKLSLGLIAVAALAFTSCKKTLDINKDPNNPTLNQGSPKLVFPAAVASVGGRIGGDLAILGGIWSQFWTQNTTSNQYKNIDAFNLTKSDYGGTWTELYAGGLNDLQYVISKAKEQQDWTYYLMGTVMKAYTYQVLVDLYDQVPYTEAFKGSAVLKPKFDDGYTIYKGILAELDTALSKDFSLSTNGNAGLTDLIFPANESSWTVDPWIQFANTLKLKIYMRMVYAKPQEAEAGIKKLYTDGANFLDVDASIDVFEDADNKRNPLYEYNFKKLNTDANLKASVTFLSFLDDKDDPRIADYYSPQTGTTNAYLGINQGDFLNANTVFNTASKARITATTPVDFITAAESHFLQAEARERFYAGAGAKAQYDLGVEEAFDRYGHDASAFIASGGKYAYPSAGTFEQKLEAIITQKWASMANSHALEAFFEKNRTGYPKTSTVYSTDPAYVFGQFVYPLNGVTTGKVFATRLIWPDTERSKNPNTPAEVSLTTPVWWDVH